MRRKFENNELVEFTTQIVSAYVANNAVVAGDLPGLIGDVHSALSRASSNMIQTPKEELKPAVAVKKSLTPDYIICLEDGKKFKSLKRHLRTHYNMSPEEYREKWGLEPNYPMVAPNYAEARSNLAKKMGLGQRKGAVARSAVSGERPGWISGPARPPRTVFVEMRKEIPRRMDLRYNLQITDSFRVMVIGMPKADRHTDIGGVNDIGTRFPRAGDFARAAGAV